jgi:hypothetical protein
MTMILTLGVAVVQAFSPVVGPAPLPAAAAVDAPVHVAVQTQSTGANTVYQIVLTNTSARPITATVVQRMPDGTTSLVAAGAKVDGDRVTWSAKVAPKGGVTLQSSGALPVPHGAEPVTACVSDAASGRLLDCAVTDVAAAAAPQAPWWRRWLPLVALVAALGVLIWVGRRAWLRRKARPPREPRPRKPRREIDWRVPVGLAAAALLVVSALALIAIAPPMASAVERAQGLHAYAWNGPHAQTKVGEQTSDGSARFTIYSVSCTPGKTTVCDVTASVTAGDRSVQLFRSMQRVYTSDTTWVEPDAAAIVPANGQDVFAGELAAGTERLMALRFTLPAGATPQRLELHDGAFAGGVYLPLS